MGVHQLFRILFYLLLLFATYRIYTIFKVIKNTRPEKRKYINLMPLLFEMIIYLFALYSAYLAGFMHVMH